MATIKLDYEHDKKGFEDALKLAADAEAQGQKKVAVLKLCEDIWLQRWKPESTEVARVVSPDGKNKLKGARRLLSASTPHFKIDRDKNRQDVQSVASKLEGVASVIWEMSNHIQKVRLESELAFSGLLYDEMIVDVVCMQDVVDDIQAAASDEKDKWEKARWEGRLAQAQYQARLTPYMVRAVSPMMYFPRYGGYGVSYVYSKVKRTVAQVKEHWGARALKAIGNMRDTQEVTEITILDNTFKYVWLQENKNEPIFADVHGMPMMQTVAVRVSGTNLFEKVADQYDPFLKTMAESGLADMQNAILSSVATQLKATLNAQWDFTQGKEGDKIEIDHSQLLGVVTHPQGSSIKPFIKDILSKDIVGGIEMVRGMVAESTIYDTVLGAGAGKSDPYGLVSLMNQTGRLPVVDVKEAMGELGASTMEAVMAWWRKSGKNEKVMRSYGNELELSASEIPEVVRFACDVDVDLPQDKLQQANVGRAWMEMGMPFEWVASTYANVENPEAMRKQKVKEQTWDAVGPWVIQKVMQMVEQMTNPAPPPAPAPAPMPMQNAESGMPTEQAVGGGGMPPQPQTPRGMPTEQDMSGGGMPPVPPEMMGGM